MSTINHEYHSSKSPRDTHKISLAGKAIDNKVEATLLIKLCDTQVLNHQESNSITGRQYDSTSKHRIANASTRATNQGIQAIG